jgi:hypothetical protein
MTTTTALKISAMVRIKRLSFIYIFFSFCSNGNGFESQRAYPRTTTFPNQLPATEITFAERMESVLNALFPLNALESMTSARYENHAKYGNYEKKKAH